jgi:hypothetical protein
MRKTWCLIGLLSLLVTAASCDSKQPVQAGEQLFSIEVQSTALVNVYNVYDEWLDTPPLDGVPDTPTGDVHCDPSGDFLIAIVPWNYSAEVAIIRAGETEEELIATTRQTPEPYSNLTVYGEGTQGPAPNLPPDGNTYFLNPRRLLQSDRFVFEECFGNTQTEDPNILGEFPRFDVVMDQGDTVVFRARKSPQAPFGSAGYESEPGLGATVFLDGATVTPSGRTSSTPGSGTGFSFAFTLK